MNDSELLALAAKAAGLAPASDGIVYAGFGSREWNPLTDDGDALRMAVKLRLLILPNTSGTVITVDGYTEIQEASERCGDPYVATRRAIVRAASEIGKKK